MVRRGMVERNLAALAHGASLRQEGYVRMSRCPFVEDFPTHVARPIVYNDVFEVKWLELLEDRLQVSI